MANNEIMSARERLRAYIEKERQDPDNPLIGIRVFAREIDDTTNESIAEGVLKLLDAANH